MLTDLKVRSAKPKAKPYKLGDARGLYLYVLPSGVKSWRYDYRLQGRRRTLTLGRYDDVSLEAARGKLSDARRLVAAGTAPSPRRAPARQPGSVTLETAGRRWFDAKRTALAPLTRRRVSGLLHQKLIPALGSRPVHRLAATDVLALLERLPPVTARRTKHVCSQVLRFAVARGWTERDVTADLRGQLPAAPAVRHHAALTDPQAVGALLRGIDALDGSRIVRTALQIAALVFVRPGELRHAEWKDVDLRAAIWRIPSGKTKTRTAHLVPLSRQAVELLTALQPITGSSRWVFPTVRNPRRPMSENTLGTALTRLGYAGDTMTVHGFRAMARTLLAEVLQADPFVIEVQLGHAAPGPLGSAYNRAKYLPQRTTLMQTWSDYLDTLKAAR